MKQATRRLPALCSYLLAAYALFVLVAAPLLFVAAENAVLRSQTLERPLASPGDEAARLLSYIDGLYWSVLAAGSIGYGDLAPQTTVGAALTALHSVLRVVAVGLVAALTFDWVTPRKLT